MPEFNVSATDSGKIERVVGALNSMDAQVVYKVRQHMEAEAERLAAEARAHLMQMPSKNFGGTDLRRRIAEGVVVSTPMTENTKTLVLINTVVDSISEAPIPLGIETLKGWRHPTFGKRGKGDWVAQKPQFRWFTLVMQPAEADLTAQITTTLGEIAEDVGRA